MPMVKPNQLYIGFPKNKELEDMYKILQANNIPKPEECSIIYTATGDSDGDIVWEFLDKQSRIKAQIVLGLKEE